MKSNLFFYLGVIINAILILICLSSALMMNKNFEGINGSISNPMEGMTEWGRIMIWVIPFALLAVIGGSFWLRLNGKILVANILLWIPALPMLLMFLIWGGLALIFVLFGK